MNFLLLYWPYMVFCVCYISRCTWSSRIRRLLERFQFTVYIPEFVKTNICTKRYLSRLRHHSIGYLFICLNDGILCLWFRASLIYINNCRTRCNTKQLPPSNVVKLAWPRCREVAAQKIWPVPEAVRVLCTPDDGCGWHPKRVEWTCGIINRLLCVASRWTVININDRMFVFGD